MKLKPWRCSNFLIEKNFFAVFERELHRERLFVFPHRRRPSRSLTNGIVIAASPARRPSLLHGYANNICSFQANSITPLKSQYCSVSAPFQNAFLWIRKQRDKVKGFLTSRVREKSRRRRLQWSHATVISSLFSWRSFQLDFSLRCYLPASSPASFSLSSYRARVCQRYYFYLSAARYWCKVRRRCVNSKARLTSLKREQLKERIVWLSF